MKSSIVFVLVAWLAAYNGLSQGLVLDDAAYAKAPRRVYDSLGAKDGNALRNTFKVDLKPYCPTVRDQGKISSCVGWSVGYAAMTIEKAIANRWSGKRSQIDAEAYSAMFLYNQIKLGACDYGAELHQALTFVQEKGNVLYRDFVVSNACDSVPAIALRNKAVLNRMKSFAALFTPDAAPEAKIDRVKLALAGNKPVVVGMVVLENFLTLKSSDPVWYPGIGKTNVFGGHAMVVIGFDDTRKAFEVMNSWGTGWANSGFAWIRYDDFASHCKYAYQFVLARGDQHYLEGNLQVLRPVLKVIGEEGVSTTFAPVPFTYTNDRFRVRHGGALPLEFQLIAEGLLSASYLYVVSLDKDLQPTVHWPRDESLNRQFAAEYNSAVVTTTQPRIVLPAKYNVFSITQPGTEYLWVLHAHQAIKDLPARLEQFASLRGDVNARVQKVFGNQLIRACEASYTGDRIHYFAPSAGKGTISLLLEFDVKK